MKSLNFGVLIFTFKCIVHPCCILYQEINVCIVLIAFIASGIMYYVHVLVVLGFKRGPNQPFLKPVHPAGFLTSLCVIPVCEQKI